MAIDLTEVAGATVINVQDDVDVQVIDWMGSDSGVVAAARVSTQGSESLDAFTQDIEGNTGLLNFLMKNRHGTPFEHNSITFYIAAPIFVFREFHRHRIGWSYNEESGRYKQLEPKFYVPRADRPLRQEGKPGHYIFVPGTPEQQDLVVDEICENAVHAYASYQRMLDAGIAKEVARTVLPVGIFSSMFATCNLRSLMAFLSLRTKDETSTFPSYPQDEIELVARKMEGIFSDLFPVTWDLFNKNGRVAP